MGFRADLFNRFLTIGGLLIVGLIIGRCQSLDGELTWIPFDRGLKSHPLSESKKDTRKAVKLDPKSAFRLEFGKGSGLAGLDTVVFKEGNAVVHRRVFKVADAGLEQRWVRASVLFPAESRKRIGKKIVELGILDMDREYHADVYDGTQCVFWLSQGDAQKSIYFNNHFPKAIREFHVALIEELKKAGLGKVKWTQAEVRNDRALWKRIRD